MLGMAMPKTEGSEKFLAEFHGVRHKKQEGVLFLTSVRFAWASGNIFQVNHPYNQIKAQRVSAEGSSKVQLQLILVSETQLNFHFTGVRDKALTQRNQCKELLQRMLQQVPPDPNLQAKSDMLNSTPSLHQLYRELVVGGVISAEEFWANRLASQSEEGSSSQEPGLPSAFLAELEAVSDGSDGCNAMKLSVTHEVIEAIFRTYPSVKAKHADLVPDKMREEEFWIQFFQSQRFHRDVGAKSKNLLTSCLAEEERGLKEGLKKAEGVLNTAESPEEGYSIFSSTIPPTSSGSSSSSAAALPQSLVQRCNLHSSMVLQAIGKGEETAPQLASQSPDLASGEPQEARLDLVPPTQTSVAVNEVRMGREAAELAQWIPQQAINHQAVYSAVNHLLPGGSLMVGEGGGGSLMVGEGGRGGRCGRSAAAQLSVATREQLFHHQATVAELLRHFWACFPILTPQLGEKAQRMSSCLQDYSGKLTATVSDSSLPEAEVVAHLQTCIRIALDKYQTWQNRRTKT